MSSTGRDRLGADGLEAVADHLCQAGRPAQPQGQVYITGEGAGDEALGRLSLPLARQYGLRAGIVAEVPGHGSSDVMLAACASQPGAFSPEDAHFLQTMANVLSLVVGRARPRHRAEEDVEKIVQAKHEWQISVDALPLVVCFIDETGRVIRTNSALESWRLGTVESVRGTPANVLLHPVCAAPDCQVRERRRMVHGGSSDGADPAVVHVYGACQAPDCELRARWLQAWQSIAAGRVVEAIGAANTVSVGGDISVFAKGTDPLNRNAQVIHAKDTRNFGLSAGDGTNPASASSVMARALKDYYARVSSEIPAGSPHQTFVQHEQSLRRFGDQLNERLAAVPVPPSLAGLFGSLNNGGFAKQCVNVFDSVVGADLFQMRCISMNYGGWDTHRLEKARFEANIDDILGLGKGLHTLTDELADKVPDANDNLVYLFTTDFGRQLRANADRGTDHGRGNYVIMVGPGVNGGTYGEMFPERERLPDPDDGNQIPYDRKGGDIKGQTDFQLVLSRACDWVQPGTGVQVFPNTVDPNLPVEPGVDLSGLFIGPTSGAVVPAA